MIAGGIARIWGCASWTRNRSTQSTTYQWSLREMARIWIVNVAGHDFSDARRFADELIPLTEGRVNIFNVKALVDEFKTKMESYEKEDWLLLSGSSVINIVASQIVMEKHGELKLLI